MNNEMNTNHETIYERFRREAYELELKRQREQQVKLSDEQIARIYAREHERAKLNLIIPRG